MYFCGFVSVQMCVSLQNRKMFAREVANRKTDGLFMHIYVLCMVYACSTQLHLANGENHNREN